MENLSGACQQCCRLAFSSIYSFSHTHTYTYLYVHNPSISMLVGFALLNKINGKCVFVDVIYLYGGDDVGIVNGVRRVYKMERWLRLVKESVE